MTDENEESDNAAPASSVEEGASTGASSAEDQVAKTVARAPASKNMPVLKDKYEIVIDRPIEKYSNGEVKAYDVIARKNEDQNENFFAIICERHIIPRRDAIESYRAFNNPCLVHLEESGVVYWPPAKEERLVFIYKDNLGNHIFKKGQIKALGWRPDFVINTVIKPMILVFQDFRDKSFVHGNIRLENFFDGDAKKLERVILGDCLSAPASYLQPSIYETAHRAMATPEARGRAMPSEDLYAFGVTLAMMLRHEDPMEGKSEEEIIRQKMEHGTFSVMFSNDRFQGAILDLLRGLLQDDLVLRWTIDDIIHWGEGNRPNAKRGSKEKKAARPLVFNNKKYLYASYLGMDLQDNPADVVRMVDDDSLQQWVERSLENDSMLERVENSISLARSFGVGPDYPDRLAGNLSYALDLHAPIRFCGLKMHGEGIGTALAKAAAKGSDLEGYMKVFSQNVASNWATSQVGVHSDAASFISRFDIARGLLRQNKLGFGIEKVLYFLCPGAHCMSEKLKGYYVDSPEAFMNAFEDMCEKGRPSELFIDRHSAAFLHTKDAKDVERYLADLNANEYHRRIIGNLGVMASVQRRSGMGSFKAIAANFMGMMDPVFERFHDSKTRDALRKEVAKFAKEGKLWKMVDILDNVNLVAHDLNSFRSAMAEYAALGREYEQLEYNLADKVTFGRGTGKDVAAVISVVLASIIIVSTFLMNFG